jgi:hypothetical protein
MDCGELRVVVVGKSLRAEGWLARRGGSLVLPLVLRAFRLRKEILG